ncbi:MAG: OmpH family outer membrane protein [Spirochaetaceae bacterium]|jgi:outer membrane protein|nr:OmpH family outer membrane protein [Spirochaetaceae bacterium]
MKRIIITVLLWGGIILTLQAQHSITRFAVVDMNRITAAYAEQNVNARNFNEKSARIQAEIDKLNQELQVLNDKLTAATESNENPDQIKTLENQIRTKTQAVKNYIRTSFTELERERAALARNDTIVQELNSILRIVAESEGYSMVLSKQDGSGILWYSPSVDITNKVIARIRAGNTSR